MISSIGDLSSIAQAHLLVRLLKPATCLSNCLAAGRPLSQHCWHRPSHCRRRAYLMNSTPYQSAFGTPSRRDLEPQSQTRHLQQEGLQSHMPEQVHKLLLPRSQAGRHPFLLSRQALLQLMSTPQPLSGWPRASVACRCKTPPLPSVSHQHQDAGPTPEQQAASTLTCNPA